LGVVSCVSFRVAEERGEVLAPVVQNFTAFLVRYLFADWSRGMRVHVEVDVAPQQLPSVHRWMRILDDLLNAFCCNAGVSRNWFISSFFFFLFFARDSRPRLRCE
jgi:hypothetical protein